MTFIQNIGVKCFCCLILQIGLVLTIWAGEEQYVQTIPVSNGVSIQTNDPLFPSTFNPTWESGANIAHQEVSNQIIFRLDPSNTTFQACNFVATVNLSVSYTDALGVNLTQTTSLTVEYNNDRGVVHQDQDYFIFTGGHQVNVTIDNLTVNYTSGSCTVTPNNLLLDNKILITRHYNFNPNTIGSFVNCSLTPTYLANSNEAELIWNPIPGAEVYELEWFHINDYNGIGGALIPSLLEFDFRKNSTRIQTSKTTYLIPIVYDQGYIVFRFRAIGLGGSNFDIPIAGNWTISDGMKIDPTA